MQAVARSTDPETSHAAAASVDPIRVSQAAVYRVLMRRPDGGFTDEELIEAYGQYPPSELHPAQSPSGLRSRRSELVRRGLVMDSGNRRKMTTGRFARVWRIA